MREYSLAVRSKISDLFSNFLLSRAAVKIELSPEETDELNRWLKSGKTEQRKGERVNIGLVLSVRNICELHFPVEPALGKNQRGNLNLCPPNALAFCLRYSV
jgi:hypothetical protein